MTTKERHFLPGQGIVTRPEWKRPASPRYPRARVVTPGRVHWTVFDFSKMAPGLGGGGLGISVDTVQSEVDISVAQGSAAPPEVPTARHLLQLFKGLVGYERDDISIVVPKRIQYAHGGFGSNVTFNTAVIAGLNALFGSPFSISEMWHILTQNFVENAEDGERIYTGLDTGVGEACVLYGGMVWIDEGTGYGDGRYLGSIPVDKLWVVTGVGVVEKMLGDVLLAHGKEGEKGMGDKTEADVVAGVCQEYQKNYGAALKKLIEEGMRPAMLRNDLRGLLGLGWELNKVGNIKVLEGIYQPDILHGLTGAMRDAGALYAGMSSAGPGFFAFAESEQSASHLRDVLASRFSGFFGNFAVGRAGTKLSIEVQVR